MTRTVSERVSEIFDLMEKLSEMESTAEFVATVLRYLITGSEHHHREQTCGRPWKSGGQKE